MIGDFVAPEVGWLRAPDGENARVVFRAGKGRDGYMMNSDILEQFERAVAIVKKQWPDEDHYFVYDNAPTHLKRQDCALSASNMTKGPSANFHVAVDVLNEHGRPVVDADGKKVKAKERMANGTHNGQEQSFYFPDDYEVVELRGWFKGTERILQERGYNTAGKKSQCGKSFHNDCPKDRTDCCCRRMLYSEPDFQQVSSQLELLAKLKLGVSILYLPKFHCELNFIEQCWGYAKARYRVLPPTKSQEDMEKNVLKVLDEIPLETMQRFATRSLRFAHAYSTGLNGAQAAWVAKKYRGHRTIPDLTPFDLVEINKRRDVGQ
ncbi:hypothetical protein CYLTODRAFT_363543 [Cylindrobasidium torrendii FP15055 ss-10]|uniref:Uncharacterized protein n=1 Tax=Cylindrobasidium torrendii FP15055 ss-10 TaxID=1314674 RepID=A0A0D7ASE2_9AGAR|nr:hypothetical protein CYLTODRAFT_363543 [Cylindrobasidium torrendii FP15055 ss-10]